MYGSLKLMNLDKLKNDWESLAERDALGAILTDPSKVDGTWDVAEFMATGDAEIEIAMNYLASIGRSPNFSGAALDFGCGVGRLTQSLGRRFASCVGIDISPQMIKMANSLNQDTHCRYLVCPDTRLPFADKSFSFIYSNIVLQHVPRPFSEQYLREFARVLLPGGVLVFGVQLSATKVVDIQFTNTAAKDFNGRLVYLAHAPISGYVGKQYCVVKEP